MKVLKPEDVIYVDLDPNFPYVGSLQSGLVSFNFVIKAIVGKIAEEKDQNITKTKLFIVSRRLFPTSRVDLVVGCNQDDDDILYRFALGKDLDDRQLEFLFNTRDIAAITTSGKTDDGYFVHSGNEYFILLKD